MAVEIARDEFGARQVDMTARWYENVKMAHGDVDAYIATRHSAYLHRWKEAARFIPVGSRVLDIGGGNLYPALIEFFKNQGYKYCYLDVDPTAVKSSSEVAKSHGLLNAKFKHGFNDSLPFKDGDFDAIFSSHCLEHSFDLAKTFAEVSRVLTDRGHLLMGVPFGWEDNPEHPYFFGPQEWLCILTDSGFQVRSAQISSEYVEQGHDYFVACDKVRDPSNLRLNTADYTKTSYGFVSCFDPSVRFHGRNEQKADHVIVMGSDSYVDFEVPPGVQEVLPIFGRHDWSGIVEVSWGEASVVEDLYSWFPYAQPVRVAAAKNGGDPIARFRAVGRNALSHSSQLVLYGIHYR